MHRAPQDLGRMVSWRRSFRRNFGIDLSQKAADNLVVACDVGTPFLFPIFHLVFSALKNQGQDILLLTRERDPRVWEFYRHRVSSSQTMPRFRSQAVQAR